jgi:hypothetical protein
MDITAIVGLVLKAVALGMGVVSIVLGFFQAEARTETHITLLGIGLTALAIASLQ